MFEKLFVGKAVKKGRYRFVPIAIVDGAEYADGNRRELSEEERFHYQYYAGGTVFESDADRALFRELMYFEPLSVRQHYDRYRPKALNIGSIDTPKIYAVFDRSVDTKVRVSNPKDSLGNMGSSSTRVFNLESGDEWKGLFGRRNIHKFSEVLFEVLTRPRAWKPLGAEQPRYSLWINMFHPNTDEPLTLKGNLANYRHTFPEQDEASRVVSNSWVDVMWLRQQELVAFKGWDAQYPDIKRKAQELGRKPLITKRLPVLLMEARLFMMEVIERDFMPRLSAGERSFLDSELRELRALDVEGRAAYGTRKYAHIFESHLLPPCQG
jgi:hypothetical protein